MDYHALTMNEPRDSPARRQQFLVICIIMAGVFMHAFVTAGGLQTVEVERGIFPGGDFVYKFTGRDYATAPSLLEWIAREAGLGGSNNVDRMYTVYLDDPRGLGGPRQRFAAGFLATDKKSRNVVKSLLNKNSKIVDDVTEDERSSLGVLELWSKIKYQSASLPSVNCGVVQFPFTNGFVSALILQYKIIPALRSYATEHRVDGKVAGSGSVVIGTCSVAQEMCTHYVPLIKTKQFHLGRSESESYQGSLPAEPLIDWEGMKTTIRKYVPGGSLIF